MAFGHGLDDQVDALGQPVHPTDDREPVTERLALATSSFPRSAPRRARVTRAASSPEARAGSGSTTVVATPEVANT